MDSDCTPGQTQDPGSCGSSPDTLVEEEELSVRQPFALEDSNHPVVDAAGEEVRAAEWGLCSSFLGPLAYLPSISWNPCARPEHPDSRWPRRSSAPITEAKAHCAMLLSSRTSRARIQQQGTPWSASAISPSTGRRVSLQPDPHSCPQHLPDMPLSIPG